MKKMLFVAVGSAVAIACTSVASKPPSNKQAAMVEYRGSILFFRGISYLPDPTENGYAFGRIMVFARAYATEPLADKILLVGLKSKRHDSEAGDWFLVEVPKGFETQWASAFRSLPAVLSASVDHVVAPN